MSRRESDCDCAGWPTPLPTCSARSTRRAEQLPRASDRLRRCRSEVDALQPVVDELPASAAAAAAPAALRERVLAIVRAEAELLHAAGPSADRPPSARRRWRPRSDFALGISAAAAAGLAALVAVLIAVGSSGHAKLTVTEGKGLGHARTAQVSLRQRDGRAELVVAHMPQPAVGRIYEVWLSRGSGDVKPTNALFSVTGTGSGSVDVPNSLHGVREVMVTSEPAGGSLHPTTSPLLRVALRSA